MGIRPIAVPAHAAEVGGSSRPIRLPVFGSATQLSRRTIAFSAGLPAGSRGQMDHRTPECMVMDNATAPEVEVLVRAAFEKSWQFVSTDPVLAHGDVEDLRTRLSKRLTRLAQDGERDLWRLANDAIGDLRRELTAP